MGEHDPDGPLDPAWQRVLADLYADLAAERAANERLRGALGKIERGDVYPHLASYRKLARAALSPSTDDTAGATWTQPNAIEGEAATITGRAAPSTEGANDG